MDKMREEFEVAYMMHICGCDAEKAKSKIKRLDGDGLLARHSIAHDYKYCLQSTDDAWWAWQSSRSSLCVKMPRCWNDEQRDYRDNMLDSLDDAGIRHE